MSESRKKVRHGTFSWKQERSLKFEPKMTLFVGGEGLPKVKGEKVEICSYLLFWRGVLFKFDPSVFFDIG